VTRLQALGQHPAFKGHGHVTKLLSLMRDTFSLREDVDSNVKFTGFAPSEQNHRWSVDEKASVTIPLKSTAYPRPKLITLNTFANVTATHPQVLYISLNGGPATTYHYTTPGQKTSITMAIPDNVNEAKFDFNLPNAMATLNDERRLGVAL